MRSVLTVLGVLLLAPFFLGVVCGFGIALNVPWVSRWLENHEAKRAAPLRKGSGDRPTTPRPAFPEPKPDKRYYRPAKTVRPS